VGVSTNTSFIVGLAVEQLVNSPPQEKKGQAQDSKEEICKRGKRGEACVNIYTREEEWRRETEWPPHTSGVELRE
jgi:predicted acyl esterase